MTSSPTLIHLWNHCHHCGQEPILGTRYECQTCPIGPDADFCETCYQAVVAGTLAHPDTDQAHLRESGSGSHQFRSFLGQDATPVEAWLQVPMAECVAPQVANGSVLRPEFCCGYESTFASYSFVVTDPQTGQLVLLTALHVMDELLRKKRVDATDANPHYTGRELPGHLTHVNLYDLYAPNWMLAFVTKTGPMLVLPSARIRDPEPRSDRDIAAFAIRERNDLAPLKLAKAPPAVGEPIWLAASFGKGHSQRCFKAVTVAVWDQGFVFRYEEERDGPPYTSGAPLLNAAGEVVAINVGGGKYSGKRFGHGNHVNNITRHLSTSRT